MSITDVPFWTIFPLIFVAFVATVFLKHRRRLAFIDAYEWPPGLISKLRRHYPSLTPTQYETIGLGLKQFFRAYHRGGYRNVAMPSQAVDELWHEFILYTKAYDAFCRNAFGRFLHHSPAIVLAQGKKPSNEGLRRVWWYACKEENIDPRKPDRLPLLFAIDTDLNIPNGYRYAPDCEELRRGGEAGTQCGGDFSSVSIDGGTDGFGDGGGDGGGGCGGD